MKNQGFNTIASRELPEPTSHTEPGPTGITQPRYQSASKPVMLIVIVYGIAIITILP